jgi:hypothetical protein
MGGLYRKKNLFKNSKSCITAGGIFGSDFSFICRMDYIMDTVDDNKGYFI